SRALKLDDYDRRWLVPGVTESGQPTQYFKKLRAWLQEDGLAIIANWAQEYVAKEGPVLAGEHAPLSDAKIQTIEDSRSEGEGLMVVWVIRFMYYVNLLPEKKLEPRKLVLRLDRVGECWRCVRPR